MKYVTYLRVSTKKQEESGLGLEAQRTTVSRFAAEGGILAEYIEVESGKKSDRPRLREAIELCRREGVTLVVAKLDRLARNVLFTATLMDSGIEFVCCDMPSANRLTIHVLAAIAEDEARRISARTKAALAELKAKGVPLGSARPGHWDGREDRRGWLGMDAGKKTTLLRDRFEKTYASVIPLVKALHERGESADRIAQTLNSSDLKTSRGKAWSRNTVQRVVIRLTS